MKRIFFSFIGILVISLETVSGQQVYSGNLFKQIAAALKDSSRLAGFRASQIYEIYPNQQFPRPGYWLNVGQQMAAKFPGTTPAAVWIVSLYCANGLTQLNFPSPGGNYANIDFLPQDQNEVYLNYFDQAGFKVWLQVEPGAARVDTLIHLVLKRYQHHPCVVGFGIDVEWLAAHQYNGGRKVSNQEAERWERKVKGFNPKYTLFLKHYGASWMPAYRGQILFIDDSQIFTSMNALVTEFKEWGSRFSPNKVAFQLGYDTDRWWWSAYSDPARTLGQALFDKIPNCHGVFWVDFTINQLFPISGVAETNDVPVSFELDQNFPNPFNGTTQIRFVLPRLSLTSLTLFDISGRLIATIIDDQPITGERRLIIDASALPSGTYFYKLNAGALTAVKKMLLLK
ncbi:T9SS type A sorting domain-containing protein [candidate division KSB1 bacterium]|nr:T9SS type A sorting domain-containing protein [candidate division KSB1 bacterium]